jgi:hypothetical protein
MMPDAMSVLSWLNLVLWSAPAACLLYPWSCCSMTQHSMHALSLSHASPHHAPQALEMFLTAETELASHHQWVTMLPPSATVLETTTRFSMQLLGRESSVVDPVSAAQATNKGGDFMRALKEQAQVGQRT